MYATKRINKNKIDVSYISIQDPYVENRKLPPRWKEKQFAVAHLPNPENGGYFAKKTYAPDPYKEAVHFIKEQPADSRKLGFGTKDASKRGEFTATIRTEQYRETLKKEQRILDHQRDPAAETMTLERARKREEERSFPEGLSETRRLYDIGRQNVTDFDPRQSRDTFYTLRKDRPKRLGHHQTAAAAVGSGAWDHEYSKPEFGPIPYVKNFYDKGHLGTQGF
ncbi:unnamed protein product [Heterosigma akashiwo]|uniref:Uncharacterized protein n=1 Tax=Heterosigma akashiwo TaxID=2829 RepID=A0A6V1R9I1_HETAK|mmetsp:Transcript_31794/g.55285  ORF Transcript_31794/g.55285 Transcript_31794/m.55285 type:complete len:223 (+) Transcript_31794:85-753(+)|eukprot:CAMPEP_0194587920 /NCGR_PEP_ID=MMETSP0292-20121207/19453_1 /TAXON_ID=39354 /ORGANISM="Heterosigma akashiwo, Strain CCMP2393" /LENGTH=222 /DNA_ID=CAMNT_0039444287 /DNA_START=71 /DNA_END=739 /DNA_ORIENTATION=+